VADLQPLLAAWLTSSLSVLAGVKLEEATAVAAHEKTSLPVLIAQVGRVNELGLVVH
jgi:hypothetical protein